jgi:hypothetical protein
MFMRKFDSLISISSLALLVFLYFADVLFSSNVFSFRDLSRYYYPFRFFAFSEIKSGNFPFWNPYVGSGHPLFAALQSVVLYPISIIYLLSDFDSAFNYFIIFHVFLGGLFFYLLMRDLKFNHISSCISGISFMFGGYLIAVINLTTTLAAAIWFPLVFLFYNRALNNKKLLELLLSSIFLGFMFLGGEPTPMYATIFILGVYSVLHMLKEKNVWVRVPVTYIVFILVFMLLFSFQILPMVELIKLSNRGGSSFEGASYWSFPPRDLINLIMPFFYGPLHFREDTPMRQDWLLLSYVGVIPLLLFFIGLFFRRDEYSNYFKLVFFLGLLFVFGKFTPVYKLFYNYVPGFGLIRYPVKFFFLSAVSFSFLAGVGWQEYYDRLKSSDQKFKKFIKRLFLAGFMASIVFFTIYIFKKQIFSCVFNYIDALKSADDEHKLKYFTVFSVNLYNFRRVLLFFIVGVLLLFVGAKTRIKLGAVGAFVLLLSFVDLYGGKNIDVNPVISKKVLHKETPNIAFLKNDRNMFRIYTSSKMNKENEVLRGNEYEEAFAVAMDHLASNRLVEFGIYDARGYFSIHNINYCKVINVMDTAPSPSSTNLLNMLNVKYILTPEEIDDKRCKLVNTNLNSSLYENLDVLPRAYLVNSFTVIKNEGEIAEKMKKKEFNPAKEVILEEDPVLNCTEGEEGERERVEIIKYKANGVEIDVNIKDKPKTLVLADNYYPGWQVFVDGKKDKIYKANFVLRGVYLNTGKHRVEFIFRPVSFTKGVMISLVSLLIVIILAVRQFI